LISSSLSTINPYAIAIAAFSIVASVGFSRIGSRIPGTLVAIILTTLAVSLFELPVETIGSRFGSIPAALPDLKIPDLKFSELKELLQPALAIALLGGIESLLCAVVADGMIGGNHRPNAELVGQGLANIACALTGGIPATGAIARTATNVKNGARTPLAGIVHALVLLAIALFAAKWAELIPMACLGGILAVVSWNMCEFSAIQSIFKTTKSDWAVFLATFLITVLFDLVLAIEIGMVLAAFLFIRRMSESLEASELGQMEKYSGSESSAIFEDELSEVPDDVVIYEINGPLFFGAAQRFYDSLRSANLGGKVLILRMRNVPMIDATGLQRLADIIGHFQKKKVTLLISGASARLKSQLTKPGIIDQANIKDSIKEALEAAQKFIEQSNAR
jgi:SulP family sulfate permease